MGGSGAVGAARRHQHALDLDAALARPSDRAHVGEHAALDDRWSLNDVRRVHCRRALIEPRELGARPCAWCVVHTSAAPSVINAGGRGHGVADERVAAPALLAPTVQPDPAAGVPGAVGSARTRANRRRTTRRRPPSAGRATGRLAVPPVARSITHDAARQQPVVARVALDHRGVAAVAARAQVLRSATSARRASSSRSRVEVEPGDNTPWYQPEPEWSSETTADDGVVPVPVDLPDAQLGGPTSIASSLAREVDQEQSPAEPRRAPNAGRVGGCRHRSPHARSSRGRSEPGIGGEHQQRSPSLDQATLSAEPCSVGSEALARARPPSCTGAGARA